MPLLVKIAACALALSSLTSGLPSAGKYVLHEKRSELAESTLNIQKRTKLPGGHVLPIRIGLTQSGLESGHDWLMDVSHPESPNYGKHWTAADVNKAFAPSTETVHAVRDWLLSAGINHRRITVSDNRGWIAFDASVEEAEDLFGAQYHQYGHSDRDKYTLGCDYYYLPEHIQQHVDYITPGVKHQIFKRSVSTGLKQKRNMLVAPESEATMLSGQDVSFVSDTDVVVDAKAIPVNCSNYVVDGDCIRAMYGLPDINVNKAVDPSNALGIFEQQGQTYSPDDLKLFFENYMPEADPNTIPEVNAVDGAVGAAPQNVSGGEAMLDLDIAYALIYPQKINYIPVDDEYYQTNYYYDGFGDTLLDALDGSFCTYSAFGQKGDNNTVDPVYPDPHNSSLAYKGPLECGTLTPPKVISFSYGPGENIWPVNYEKRQCNEWMKLALQGTTAVFASGDNGLAGQISSVVRDRTCLMNNTVFAPPFPASCPYVLVVGATQIRPNVSGLAANPEQAVVSGSYTSGAGFSNVFERPSYQDDAVNAYFANANNTIPFYKTSNGKNIGENGGLFNRAGRAMPDVAANGAWFHVYTQGKLGRTGGTSQSAPLFASVVNLINEARLKAGKSTVGFLHPTLYAHPEAFHDITTGYNKGCHDDVAFNATVGWDPVTGLGTPKFQKLKDIFMSLP